MPSAVNANVQLTNRISDVGNATHYRLPSLENLVTLTLLVDLDNTLLGNDMETFIPAYLQALGEHLSQHVPMEKMVTSMLSATQLMIQNICIQNTLKEAFDPGFYPPLGFIEKEMRGIFEQFYAENFPRLKGLTQYRPEALDFIQASLDRDFQVGIATNPMFPRTAIVQRLEWAGLSPDEIPFTLIPSYETFHFTKPNPAFFAEFLTWIGWPNGPVLMVGNDPNHDVKGAQGMGIPVFWISENGDKLSTDQSSPDGSGTLTEVLPWVDAQPTSALIPDYTSHSAMIATLRGSPAALNIILPEIPKILWSERPSPDSWSLTEILCHLRDVEREINLPRLRKALQEDNPFISGVDSDAWAEERSYIQQDGPSALREFLAARIETLDILDNLDGDGWERPIRHAIFGPTDLKEIVRIITDHERLHDRQIHDVSLTHGARV
jgi:FMN phosphatase YigB (HAD superfamily)